MFEYTFFSLNLQNILLSDLHEKKNTHMSITDSENKRPKMTRNKTNVKSISFMFNTYELILICFEWQLFHII